MSNVARRAKRAVELAPAVYTIGVFFAVVLLFLVITGRVRVRHWRRLFTRGPVILAPNHPAMLEPFLIIALFTPLFLACPWLVPWSTPDVRNFMQKWWFFLARPGCIGVARKGSDGHLGKARRAARQVVEVLKKGDTVSIHSEGGRTDSGTGPRVTSPLGNVIREIRPNGITLAVGHVPGLRIVPIWFKGADKVMPRGSWFPWRWWHRITVEVGEPFSIPSDTPPEEVARRVEQAILACGDRT